MKLNWLVAYLFILSSVFANAAPTLSNKKIQSPLGRKLVELVTKTLNVQDTTSARRETKAIISKSLLTELQTQLETNTYKKHGLFTFLQKEKNNSVVFNSRDQKSTGAKNGTFTFYGKGMFFWNLGVKTKIKLRARAYLQLFPDHTERSKITANSFFLELKVKNPDPNKPGSVEKFRAKILDQDLLALYQLDPDSQNFVPKLRDIENNVIALDPEKAVMVSKMFYVIYQLAKVRTGFIRPLYAISYTREAKEFTEQDYRRRKLFGKKRYKEVQYQFTVDENIKGFLPKFDPANPFDLTKYVTTNKEADLAYAFPSDAVSVELKVPQMVADFQTKEMSFFHRKFAETAISALSDPNNRVEGFASDRGKIGHFRAALKQDPRYAHLFDKEKKDKKQKKAA